MKKERKICWKPRLKCFACQSIVRHTVQGSQKSQARWQQSQKCCIISWVVLCLAIPTEACPRSNYYLKLSPYLHSFRTTSCLCSCLKFIPYQFSAYEISAHVKSYHQYRLVTSELQQTTFNS